MVRKGQRPTAVKQDPCPETYSKGAEFSRVHRAIDFRNLEDQFGSGLSR